MNVDYFGLKFNIKEQSKLASDVPVKPQFYTT